MAKLVVHNEKIDNKGEAIKLCPFGAMDIVNDNIEINASCKMCRLCVRKGPEGAFEYVEGERNLQ